ncbi:MAG TPA: class D sortase [Clostridiaceae bacterium]|nr:class D sortase [Clostridiaceae bacterium]
MPKIEDSTSVDTKKQSSRGKKIIDRLLIVLIVVSFTAGIYLLIKPRIIKHRQDEITDEINQRIDSGLMEPIVVPKDANKVEGETYDYYGYEDSDIYEINYEDIPGENVELIPLGRLEIPKIHVNLPILEYATRVQLRYGLAHVETTAKPGETGNNAMLGHRMLDSGRHLNRLDEVNVGDQITINTGTDFYTYEVFDMIVIDPAELMSYVDKDYGMPTLTLITCDPIPTWEHRLLCIAKQVGHETLAED